MKFQEIKENALAFIAKDNGWYTQTDSEGYTVATDEDGNSISRKELQLAWSKEIQIQRATQYYFWQTGILELHDIILIKERAKELEDDGFIDTILEPAIKAFEEYEDISDEEKAGGASAEQAEAGRWERKIKEHIANTIEGL